MSANYVNANDTAFQLSERLRQLIAQTELAVSDAQIEKLVGFVLLMSKWNKAYNLSAVRDTQQMLVKHIMDSIVVAPFLTGQHIADVGTGPGLPGVPLAILYPEKSFTLIDSLGKRIRFIKQACFELKIDNVVALQTRVEDYEAQPPFDHVLSRAFASLHDMLKWCAHLVDNQGEFLALKGQLHQDELIALPAQFTLIETRELNVPELEGARHLLRVKKQIN